MLSQNVLFVRQPAEIDLHAHPPGKPIIDLIAEDLRSQGYRPCTIDDWRDCGWAIAITVGEAKLEIRLASTSETGLWIAQVASISQPGMLARLFGAKWVDHSDEIMQIAKDLHQSLAAASYRDIRWCADSYPDDNENSPEPQRE